MLPVFICIPIRSYIMIKYSPFLLDLIADDAELDCTQVPYTVGYKAAQITQGVRSLGTKWDMDWENASSNVKANLKTF